MGLAAMPAPVTAHSVCIADSHTPPSAHDCNPPPQTRGAVRDTVKLAQAAFWYKMYVAAAAAAAEQVAELQLINAALALLSSSMLSALPAVWAATGEAPTRDVAFDVAQLRNATCLCGGNTTAVLAGTPFFVDAATYTANNCSGKLAQQHQGGRSAAALLCTQPLLAHGCSNSRWLEVTMLACMKLMACHWHGGTGMNQGGLWLSISHNTAEKSVPVLLLTVHAVPAWPCPALPCRHLPSG